MFYWFSSIDFKIRYVGLIATLNLKKITVMKWPSIVILGTNVMWFASLSWMCRGFSVLKIIENGMAMECVKFTHGKLRHFDCELIHLFTSSSRSSSILLACDKIGSVWNEQAVTMLLLLLLLLQYYVFAQNFLCLWLANARPTLLRFFFLFFHLPILRGSTLI